MKANDSELPHVHARCARISGRSALSDRSQTSRVDMKKAVASYTNPHNRELPHTHYVVRLPVELAARLEALCELNPHKSRDQIVGELLGSALKDLARHASDSGHGAEEMGPNAHSPLYLPSGAFTEFHKLVRKHHLALEQAFADPGPDKTGPPGPGDAYRLDDMQ